MSLDVYLNSKPKIVECKCDTCGHVHQIESRDVVFNWNITHNLGEMAEAAKLYDALWRPENLNITVASELIPILTKGLDELECFPETYSKFNPTNGWGDYKGFVKFVKEYLQACIDNPEAEIEVCR